MDEIAEINGSPELVRAPHTAAINTEAEDLHHPVKHHCSAASPLQQSHTLSESPQDAYHIKQQQQLQQQQTQLQPEGQGDDVSGMPTAEVVPPVARTFQHMQQLASDSAHQMPSASSTDVKQISPRLWTQSLAEAPDNARAAKDAKAASNARNEPVDASHADSILDSQVCLCVVCTIDPDLWTLCLIDIYRHNKKYICMMHGPSSAA